MSRTIFVVFALAVMLVTICPGCKRNSGATPQATFDTFKTAIKNKDYKTALAQMSIDSQAVMLTGMRMLAGFAAMGDDKLRSEVEAMQKKYGVQDMELDFTLSEPELKAAMTKSVENVDIPAYMGELMTWIAKNSPEKNMDPNELFGSAELVDLKIDGDSATGAFKMKPGDQERLQPIGFKKTDGDWKIEMAFGVSQKSRPNEPASATENHN